MAQIFVSYARADRPRAEQLARALESAGWSVWWDREIPPGRSFDDVIEEALTAARCVVVLWSQASVRSEWVKTEAAEAAQRRILVPILADGARIPLEFRRIQAAAINDWRELESNEGWAQLCDAVAALVDSARRAPPVRAVGPSRQSRVPWIVGAGASVALVIAAVFAYVVSRPASAPSTPSLVAATAPVVAANPAPREAPPIPASAPMSALVRLKGRPTREKQRPATGRPETAAPAATAPATAALPVETTIATADLAPKLDREPRIETVATSFDVTLVAGVFRNHGRLVVSAAGVRFADGGGSGRDFDLPCGALRRVATATVIADREQRLLELAANERAYRVLAADTGARDGIRAAIARTCVR
jgi:hypothetical protein